MGDVSIWQLVDGESVASLGGKWPPINANQYLNQLDPSHPELRLQLNKMARVLNKMGISDLHGQNVLVTNLADRVPTKNSQFAPVDLEVQRAKSLTRLGVSGEREPCHTREAKIIQNKFLPTLKLDKCITRIVLVETAKIGNQIMGGIGNPMAVTNCFVGVKAELAKSYRVLVSDEVLKRLITEDFLNFDVPYFAERAGVLYYGTPSREIPIGQKIINTKR